MKDEDCARFLVSGCVQGVFFRASTQAEAERLQLRGYARNLADGRVEVLAAGSAEAICALERWLAHGPPAAKVDRIERQEADAGRLPDGFGVRR